MHRLASPSRALRAADAVLPWSSAAAAILIGTGLYLGLFASPPDYQQGDSVRIMYVHVPAAWMAILVYALIAAASAAAFVWKNPLGHLFGKAASPVGAAFTLVALVTGSLWGRPMWGTWWVWDARLTSVLVLFFLYLGHMALTSAFEDQARGARAAATLALVGVVNLPIIKFSVDWWSTLHQPASVLRLGGPTIHGSMLAPLMVMAGGFLAYFVTVVIVRLKAEMCALKTRALRMAAAEAGP
ncbi:MAG: heme ABC transporter permease [Alphaproteobacteria bacterium]